MIKECIGYVCASMLFLGCTGVEEVKPWEKEALAKEMMKIDGVNSNMKKFEQHVYFSKEGSKGGYGVAGGGCGCN